MGERVHETVGKGRTGLIPTASTMLFTPAATRAVRMQFCTTPGGREFPLDSNYNRTMLAAAYLADGDHTMTHSMCGFYLQAMALDRSTREFEETQTVAHRISGPYEAMEMHFAIATAMRIRAEMPEIFAAIASW